MKNTLPIISMRQTEPVSGKYKDIPHLRIELTDGENAGYSWNDVFEAMDEYAYIKHAVIIANEAHGDDYTLKELCIIAKSYGKTVTLETVGKVFVQTVADYVSIVPVKTSSFVAMREYMNNYPDYQFRVYFTPSGDWSYVHELDAILGITCDKMHIAEHHEKYKNYTDI